MEEKKLEESKIVAGAGPTEESKIVTATHAQPKEPKIVTAPRARAKDPKKVAAGKKLAKINEEKRAKLKAFEEQQASLTQPEKTAQAAPQAQQSQSSWPIIVVGGGAILLGVVAYWASTKNLSWGSTPQVATAVVSTPQAPAPSASKKEKYFDEFA